ncbi:MAG: YgjV family protein, partial [Pseudomonadota bacterium]
CVGYAYVVMHKPALMRSLFIVSEALWLIYALTVFSIPMALTCAFGIISSLVGLYRFEKDNLITFYRSLFLRTYP